MKTYSISRLGRAFGLSRSTLLDYDRLRLPRLYAQGLPAPGTDLPLPGGGAAGMDRRAMNRWHTEFERRAPEAHHEFLLALGIPPDEAATIRRWSAQGAKATESDAR